MLKLYTYRGCSTCRNAVKWLRANNVEFTEIPIRETPPDLAELRSMLLSRGGKLRDLCNTSGQDYRAPGMKEKLAMLTETEALTLLAGNGNLIKRPFAQDVAAGVFLTGFKEPEWQAALGC